jgi:hypothetical protein
MGDAAAERIRAFAADAVSAARLPDGAGRLIAVGWATVETDRAVGELADALGIAPTSFRAAPPSAALGASCLVLDVPLPGDVALAVVEPATEGRIAAGLARWDEGPLVAWYAATAEPESEPDGLAVPTVPGASATSTASGRVGPFGPERLVVGDPLTGPHRLLVDGPGTIRT